MKDWKIILWLIVFNPVGLYKIYNESDWSNKAKYLATVIVGVANVALISSGELFTGLVLSGFFISLMGLISIIANLFKKKDKKASLVMLAVGILLLGFSSHQVTEQVARQEAIEEQERQELLAKQEQERQENLLEEANDAVVRAENDKNRNRYIEADKLVEKLGFENTEITKLKKRLVVLDRYLTEVENLKKATLALEAVEEEPTEENYKKALLLM